MKCPICNSNNTSIIWIGSVCHNCNHTWGYNYTSPNEKEAEDFSKKYKGDNMKEITKRRCPNCGSLNVTHSHSLFDWWCCSCGYGWDKQLGNNYPIYPLPKYIAQAELKEHAQYLKDGIKLTNQDKYDLQIDLWQYGKEEK